MNRALQVLVILALAAPIFTQIVIPLKTKAAQTSNISILNSTNIPLANLNDLLFTGEFQIGNPPKTFELTFDTYFADTILHAAGCVNCINSTTNYYNASASTTSMNEIGPINVTYYTRYVTEQCTVYSDDLIIAGFNVTDVDLVVVEQEYNATNLSNVTAFLPNSDGLFGLGYISKHQYNSTPFAQLMQQQNLSQVFSIHLTSVANQAGSSLTLGGYDPTLATNGFTYHNVIFNNTWQLNLTDFGFNATSYKGNNTGLQAIVSPSFPMITGNPQVIESLLGAIPKVDNCSSVAAMPNFYFTLDEIEYEVQASLLYWPDPNNTAICVRLLNNGTDIDLQIPDNTLYLGAPFIQSYYATFDMENHRIGFAQGASPVPPKPLAGLRFETVAAFVSVCMSLIYFVL